LGRRKIKPKYSIGSLLLLLAFAFYIACNRDAEEKPRDGYIEKPAEQKKPKKVKDKKEFRYLTEFKGKVIGIKDGDTFEVLYDGQPEKVRLAEIDCPEKQQPFGNNARQYASQLCFGKMVTVTSSGKRDRYGRVVGTITTEEGTNVNEALIKAGLAWHYKDYSDSEALALLQQEAKAQKVGLWQDKNPVAPWNWRKHKRKMSQKKKETEVVINN
jgi:endonuclease YncB( thermonuclease family)